MSGAEASSVRRLGVRSLINPEVFSSAMQGPEWFAGMVASEAVRTLTREAALSHRTICWGTFSLRIQPVERQNDDDPIALNLDASVDTA